MEIKNYELENGLLVTYIKTDKFKTNSINLLIHNQLDKNEVSKNALLPMVLKRGCEKYPTMQELSIELENLYGSGFDVQVIKRGERQIIHFYIDFINGKYIEDDSLFLKCTEILNNVLTKPLLIDGKFNDEYVEQEKVNLINKIETKINDKVQYAVDRMYEIMCKGESFGLSELGNIEDITSITSEELTNQYKKVLDNGKFSLIIIGEVDEDKIKDLGKILNIKSDKDIYIDDGDVKSNVPNVNEVVEKMEVNQAKLSLGFRTNRNFKDSEYYALLIYASILGGGTHSKLFQNVREKESLAYYAAARFEKFKGTIAITSGIEFENHEKAKKVILEQIEAIKRGDISDLEMKDSVNILTNSFNSIMDEPFQIINYFIGQQIMNSLETPKEMISKIEKITIEDVKNVAQDVCLDTIYLIKPNN